MLQTIIEEPLPSFAVGDVPSALAPITIDTVDDWSGVTVTAGEATIDSADGATTITLTPPSPDAVGVLVIGVTLTGDGGRRAAVDPVRIVVEDPTTQWLTIGTCRALWHDAPDSDLELFELLEAARIDCLAFAPTVETIPDSYRKAQRLQTEARWTASRATSSDRMGGEEYGVTVFPLDWHVKQLLRPRTAIGGMF
ncbi:hypothetical protein [Demequina capsici]|uniref:Uncharacterized protein n=1 Tax=Demequina capsici TaxID=3075620 RepID=A0AA96F9K3_9MICO|nr:hypothetical protein [Demequina sp. OYTSA14]WNM25240.1 hypothetical protein RN606_03575 [Demequina sp. OYTSA14]